MGIICHCERSEAISTYTTPETPRYRAVCHFLKANVCAGIIVV